MGRNVTFGKADTNGRADSDDASEEDVEELRQDVRELRQDLQEERLARKQAEKEIETLRDEFEDLREQVESGGSEDVDLVEIEWKARNERYDEMTSNVERAVKIWEGLPNYASTPRDKLTLTYEQLQRAISDVDTKPKMEVNSNTVRRVRTRMKEMSDGLVEIKTKEGTDGQTHDRTLVNVQDWADQRKDVVVQKLLPDKVAETVLGGDDG